MKVTVISPFHIEVERTNTEWLRDRLQSGMDREAVRGIWKEETDTQEISWEYFRSIVDAHMYSKMLKPWRME